MKKIDKHKIGAAFRDIHTAGHVLKGVYSVKVEDIIRSPDFPRHEADRLALDHSVSQMRSHARALKNALKRKAKTAKPARIAILFGRTRELYEEGIRSMAALKGLKLVHEIIESNTELFPSTGIPSIISGFLPRLVMQSGFPIEAKFPEDSKEYKVPELHWEAHSEMMRIFAEFCVKYNWEIREIAAARKSPRAKGQ